MDLLAIDGFNCIKRAIKLIMKFCVLLSFVCLALSLCLTPAVLLKNGRGQIQTTPFSNNIY